MKQKRYLTPILLIISLLSLLSLTACSETDSVIFTNSEDNIPKKFPATIEMEYLTSNEITLFGDDVLITFRYIRGKGNYYKVYAVKKTEDGYIVHNSSYENYSIPDITEMGFSEIIKLEKRNGTFPMTFENENQYYQFMRNIAGWSDVCVRYKCNNKKESDSN